MSRKRTYRRRTAASDDEDETKEKAQDLTENKDGGESLSVTIEELIELRKYRQRPQGIEAEKLFKGDPRKKKKREDDPWKAKTGGLVDRDALKSEKEDESDSEQRKIMLDSFTKQTNVLDVDKHMMAYIEEEMSKRRGQASLKKEEDEDAPLPNPEDELFQLPEHLKIETKPISEGNVQLSTTMLTAIPEVDLGIDVRLKNIEDTEKAKRKLLEQRQHRSSNESEEFSGINQAATNRFYRTRPPSKEVDRVQPDQSDKVTQQKTGGRREMATDDIVAERFKKRLRR